jgi:hypothetical protein
VQVKQSRVFSVVEKNVYFHKNGKFIAKVATREEEQRHVHEKLRNTSLTVCLNIVALLGTFL